MFWETWMYSFLTHSTKGMLLCSVVLWALTFLFGLSDRSMFCDFLGCAWTTADLGENLQNNGFSSVHVDQGKQFWRGLVALAILNGAYDWRKRKNMHTRVCVCICVQNLNKQTIRMWIGHVWLQCRPCHKTGNKKQERSLAAGYLTLKTCVTDFSRRKYNPQIPILKQKTSFEQILNWVIQRRALVSWHFPEWERVCQGIKKWHHNFAAVHIFSISGQKHSLCLPPW